MCRIAGRRGAGLAFENNLAVIFSANRIHYSHGAVTERNNRPDFIFRGIKYYNDPHFNTSLLTMLGLKTTAKDRWRQVLSEAAKIPHKHLITLEPAISRNQTEEMRVNHLQLVIPSPLYSTDTSEQQKQLISLKDFITIVDGKQKQYSDTTLLF
ncbi:type II restriction endonuclease [Pararcticibacter amylolyticus]|uniref:type II restriction endonuclease n=1 Tax=Pararcticibacter amylolyticus TaxID=2173175 RepID=UPI001EE42F9D|nr:type II restriction endonuclease [Pararcticibacter amylolyticus]